MSEKNNMTEEQWNCDMCSDKLESYITDERGHKFCNDQCKKKWDEFCAEIVDNIGQLPQGINDQN